MIITVVVCVLVKVEETMAVRITGALPMHVDVVMMVVLWWINNLMGGTV